MALRLTLDPLCSIGFYETIFLLMHFDKLTHSFFSPYANSRVSGHLGVLYRDAGNITLAIEAYERCLQIDPDSRNAGQVLLQYCFLPIVFTLLTKNEY